MARAIDAEKYMELLKEQYLHYKAMKHGEAARAWQGAMQLLYDMPTLTPPNEWISVETPPTKQGWYHVAVLDLKTGKYTVEQDLYSIELAKAHGFEPGFCKAKRWEERERIDYWCRFPEPPDRRPLAREEDT